MMSKGGIRASQAWAICCWGGENSAQPLDAEPARTFSRKLSLGPARILRQPKMSKTLPIAAMLLAVVFSSTTTKMCASEEPRKPGRLWLMYAASNNDHDARMIGWWNRGWPDFANRVVPQHVAAVEQNLGLKVDGIQVHHPWGRSIVDGKRQTMEFSQRVRCYQDWQRSGNETLRRIMNDSEFVDAMEQISHDHDLLIYMGSPLQLKALPGETKNEWADRAKQHYGPVLSIDPPPAIGMDNTYGRPEHKNPKDKFHLTTGKDGGLAQLVSDLDNSGHEVVFEPGILRDADWAVDKCSMLVAHRGAWKAVTGGGKHRNYGSWATPHSETKNSEMVLLHLKGKTDEEKMELIRDFLAEGWDVVVAPTRLPGYPWRK